MSNATTIKVWKNKNQERNYECTNLFWAIGSTESAPVGEFWIETNELADVVEFQEVLNDGIDYVGNHLENIGQRKLYRSGGVAYYGKL